MQRYDCSRVNAWMSATVEFQQSECFGMSAVAVCHVHTTLQHGVAKMSNHGCPCGEPERFMRALHSS